MKLTVYHFRVWDPVTDKYIVPRRKSPEKRIKHIGGELFRDTAEVVDHATLDEQDRYDPSPRLPTEN